MAGCGLCVCTHNGRPCKGLLLYQKIPRVRILYRNPSRVLECCKKASSPLVVIPRCDFFVQLFGILRAGGRVCTRTLCTHTCAVIQLQIDPFGLPNNHSTLGRNSRITSVPQYHPLPSCTGLIFFPRVPLITGTGTGGGGTSPISPPLRAKARGGDVYLAVCCIVYPDLSIHACYMRMCVCVFVCIISGNQANEFALSLHTHTTNKRRR